ECYCANGYASSPVKAAETDCNMNCAGNSLQTCGAGYRLSLYTKTPPAGATLPSGWSPSMCAIDNSARVLTGYQGTDAALTPASCISKCAGLGFSLSGVENGNECYCGNFLTNSPIGARDVQCGTPCSGDVSQNCGGGYRIMVYQKACLFSRKPWNLADHRASLGRRHSLGLQCLEPFSRRYQWSVCLRGSSCPRLAQISLV
ncbi:WSC domain-containing protein, partial [Mycena sp. CBHHK59/15]